VELGKLHQEGKKIEADKMVKLLRLEHRHANVGESIRDMHRTVNRAETDARQYREAIAAAQQAVFERGIPLAEKQVYLQALELCTARLLDNHVSSGDILTNHIDRVLNGAGALSPDQLPDQRPRQNRPSNQRPNQGSSQRQKPPGQQQSPPRRRRPRPNSA